MQLGIYTILDKAVGAYMQPFYARTRMEAIRSFSDAVKAEGSKFGSHAEDYVLMYHGEWDDNSGLFSGVDPVRVVGAVEFVVSDSPFTSSNHSRAEPGRSIAFSSDGS